MGTPNPSLTPEEAAEAERIFQTLQEASADEQWRIARLLASKSNRDLLGQAEYELRDRVHRIGAKAIQTALVGRKKGVPTVETELPELPRGGQVRWLSPSV